MIAFNIALNTIIETTLNILLGAVAGCLLLGVIGEKDKDKNKNITIAFVTVVLFIVALNTIM